MDGADVLELVQQRVESFRADPVDESDELLAFASIVLIVLDDLADRLGRALGRHAGDADAVLGAADVTSAAEEDVRARDLGAVRLERRALQADGGEVVLATAVRAATRFYVDLLHEWVINAPLFDRLGDRPADALRGGDPHLAGVGARAGDGVRDQTCF